MSTTEHSSTEPTLECEPCALADRLAGLAQIEKDAEASRSKADAAYRAAWWDMSLALAEPTRKRDVTEALTVAERLLGQNREHLKARRNTAQRFGFNVEAETLRALPPGMCIEVIKHARESVTPDLVERIRQADADGESITDVMRALVGERAVNGTPAHRPGVVAAGLADPETAARVVDRMDDDTKRTMVAALGADTIADVLADVMPLATMIAPIMYPGMGLIVGRDRTYQLTDKPIVVKVDVADRVKKIRTMIERAAAVAAPLHRNADLASVVMVNQIGMVIAALSPDVWDAIVTEIEVSMKDPAESA